MARLWAAWRSVLVLVQAETVIRWRRQGFRLYWRWKAQAGPVGRPQVEREIRDLIRRMARVNPLWGAPRMAFELRFLGQHVADSTVARYLPCGRKPPSQTWRTFPVNHVAQPAAIEFLTIPTVTFRVLSCSVVPGHARRKPVHFNVTARPTAAWTAQPVVEAFPCGEALRYLLHDRDTIYGDRFRRRVRRMGMQEVRIAPRPPWQNPHDERLIGSVRRGCPDHAIVLGGGTPAPDPDRTPRSPPRGATASRGGAGRARPVRRGMRVRWKGDSGPARGGLYHRYAYAA